MDVEIRRLRAFLAVADSGSLRNAARHIFVSQSSLSQQIAALEGQLGCELFMRTSRGMALTPSGRRLIPMARTIITHSDRIRDELTTTGTGAVRAGLDDASAHGPRFVTGLTEVARDRGLHVSLLSGSARRIVELLADGTLSLAVTSGEAPTDPAVIAHRLAAEPLVALVRHDPRRHPRTPFDPATLADEPLVTLAPESFLARTSLQLVHGWAVAPASVTHVSTAQLAAQAVSAGMGTALLPRAAAAPLAASDDTLEVLPLAGPVSIIPEWLLHPASLQPPVENLVAVLLDRLQDDAFTGDERHVHEYPSPSASNGCRTAMHRS